MFFSQAASDPELARFEELERAGLVQLRVLPEVSCECFARHIFEFFHAFVEAETAGRVSVTQVTFRENRTNSATYRRAGA